MSGTISEEVFKRALWALLDETFEKHHGIFLNQNTSFFETLKAVSAEQASRPIGGKSASIAAQVAHTSFYLDVLERYMQKRDVGEVDWDEIWRTVREVTPGEWQSLQEKLETTYRRVLASMRAISSWDEAALNGALAMVVHTAYHLGGIRQALCTLR
jgi:hypothetical protein